MLHVDTRGNHRQDIVFDDDDRQFLLDRLAEAVERFQIEIHSYCLMMSHLHLQIDRRHGDISRAMQHVLGSHARWINSSTERHRIGYRSYVLSPRSTDADDDRQRVPWTASEVTFEQIDKVVSNLMNCTVTQLTTETQRRRNRPRDLAVAIARELRVGTADEISDHYLFSSQSAARSSAARHRALSGRHEAIARLTGRMGQCAPFGMSLRTLGDCPQPSPTVRRGEIVR